MKLSHSQSELIVRPRVGLVMVPLRVYFYCTLFSFAQFITMRTKLSVVICVRVFVHFYTITTSVWSKS